MTRHAYAPALWALTSVGYREPILFDHDPHKKVVAVFDEPKLTKRQKRRAKGKKP